MSVPSSFLQFKARSQCWSLCGMIIVEQDDREGDVKITGFEAMYNGRV